MTEAEVVELHGDAPQAEVFPVSAPGLVRQDDVGRGVGLHVLVGFNVGDNTGSCSRRRKELFLQNKSQLSTFISEDLGPLDMIIVVVAEEEISDGSLGHCSDFRQHCL